MTAAVVAVSLTVLALIGATVGIVLAFSRGDRPDRPASTGGDPGLLRVTAQVHTGWEQTLLGLHRELGLPRTAADVSYGALYLEPLHERQLLLRTRSEIGRGFLGLIDIEPERRRTGVAYRIFRLPQDERVRDTVLDLELRLIAALRSIDRTVEVQLLGGPLREGASDVDLPAAPSRESGGRP